MTQLIDSTIFKAKSVLCVGLLVATHIVVAGCGQSILPPGVVNTPIAGVDGLSDKLAGTPFNGAKTIDFDRSAQTFRIVSPDGSSTISGTYALSGGQAHVTTFAMSTGGRAASLKLNESRQITEIVTANGVWRLPASEVLPPSSSATAPGARAESEVDQYVAAHAGVLELARQADAERASVPASGTTTPVKVERQSLATTTLILAGLLLFPLWIVAAIIWIIEVIVVINLFGSTTA